MVDAPTGVATATAALAWLDDALGCVYVHAQMKALAYLEAVMDDVVFEMEMDERRTYLIE